MAPRKPAQQKKTTPKNVDFMSTLQRTWEASLGFFEPKEMNTLVLLSLNTTWRALQPIIKYFSWWLLIWGCYIDLFVDGNALFGGLWEYARPMWYSIGLAPRLYVATMLLITFIMMLSVRASLHAKKGRYYLTHLSKLPAFALLYVLVPQIFVIPTFWFMAFFVLDAPLSLRALGVSVYNGAVLSLGYAPFLIIMGAVHGVIFHIHRVLWELTFIEEYHFFAYIIKYGTSMLAYLFFVAMLGAFYVRVVAGNSSNKLFKKA